MSKNVVVDSSIDEHCSTNKKPSLFVDYDEWLERETSLQNSSSQCLPFTLRELEGSFQIELAEDLLIDGSYQVEDHLAEDTVAVSYEKEFDKFLQRNSGLGGHLQSWTTKNDLVSSKSFIERELSIPKILEKIDLLKINKLDPELVAI